MLRYGGLSATDARGRVLHSWMELRSGQILLRVDAAGARYPLRIDPFVQQGEKLTGGGERGEEGAFGYSVAISAEKGEYALIGGPSDNGKVGAAWVFLRSGTTWTQQGPKLTGKEEAGAGEFGESVALSEKGEYGAGRRPGRQQRSRRGVGLHCARARPGPSRVRRSPAKKRSGKGEFGWSVALAAKEGKYALIGGPNNKEAEGAAWVFPRSGTTWAYQATLTGKEESGKGRLRLQRGAVAKKDGRICADRRSQQQRRRRRRVGLRARKAPVGPTRRRSPAAARSAKANSARAWRSLKKPNTR